MEDFIDYSLTVHVERGILTPGKSIGWISQLSIPLN